MKKSDEGIIVHHICTNKKLESESMEKIFFSRTCNLPLPCKWLKLLNQQEK